MKKFILLLLSILFSLNVFALNDSEELEFTGALNDGDLKLVKKYVEKKGVNLEDKYFAWTPLLITAAKDQLPTLKYLTEKGADVNYVHPVTRWTAFIHAAFNGNKEMIDYLKAHGADINLKLKGDVSLIRAMLDDGKKDMADYLISIGVKNDGCQEQQCF
ncbi:MAG: ankyrin repeat domain-containing protein [Nitrosomonadales bacterium]|jgi:ankyrin repeat protein